MKPSLNWRVFIILIQFILILPISVGADQIKTLSLDEVLLHLKTRQETLVTFVADFQQVQQNELFAEPQKSAGTLYFDRVGKLLIKMSQPESYYVLLTDGKMISGAPGSPLHQKKLPGGKAFIQKILGMGQSADQLKKQFHIQMTSIPNGPLYELELRPIKVNRRMPFTLIQAKIDSQAWLPIGLRLVESDGDSVRFILNFTAINTSLPEDTFDIGPIADHTTASDDIHETK